MRTLDPIGSASGLNVDCSPPALADPTSWSAEREGPQLQRKREDRCHA